MKRIARIALWVIYKAMEKALDLGTEFMHMKQPEMVMALNDEKSEYVNMLIEKKTPVDLSVRVSGYETDGKEKSDKAENPVEGGIIRIVIIIVSRGKIF